MEGAHSKLETAPEPLSEQSAEAGPVPEPGPEAKLHSEATPNPEAEAGVSPASEPAEGPASRIRLRIFREGRDTVNLTFPLAVAHLVTNVTAYLSDQLTEGVDVRNLLQGVQNAGASTLVDIDDGKDRVVISLE